MKKPELTEMIDILHGFREELDENLAIHENASEDVCSDLLRVINAYRYQYITSADNATLWKIRQLAKSFALRVSDAYADLPRIRELIATLESVKSLPPYDPAKGETYPCFELPEDYLIIDDTGATISAQRDAYRFGVFPYFIPAEDVFIHFGDGTPMQLRQPVYLNYRLFGFIAFHQYEVRPVQFSFVNFPVGISLDLDGLEDRQFDTRLCVASRIVSAVRAMTPDTVGKYMPPHGAFVHLQTERKNNEP